MAETVKSGRPVGGEFAGYATPDIDAVAGDDAVEALRAQSHEMRALFASIGEKSIGGYAPGKWTLKQVMGHMIDDERIFAYRALCLARREPRALPGFDEMTYVAAADFGSRTLASLAAEYCAVRESSIAFFETLSQEQWLRKGEVNGYVASVRGLAFHIAGHELHHLRMIRERYLA